MQKSVLVPVADGTEELEAVAIIDILRRAGAQVTVASVSGSKRITASRGVVLVADAQIEECAKHVYDLVVLPGGVPGAKHLSAAADLVRILRRQREQNRLYGAICASPALVLARHGLLADRQATCHPAFVDQMGAGQRSDAPVVVDRNCVTGRGAGTAVAFALALVEQLYDDQTRDEVQATLAI